MSSAENEILKKRPSIRNKAANYFSAYANSVQLETTPWDMKFVFGLISEATDQKLVIEDQCEVLLSPQHAKVFAAVLIRNIKQYEEKFGKIPGPAGSPAEGIQKPTSRP
jgi:hypothetical protein